MKVEFRDGWREVPDYVADMMRGLDTWRWTYEESVRQAEKRMLADRLNKVQSDIIRDALRKKV